jgi:hypothetical protein
MASRLFDNEDRLVVVAVRLRPTAVAELDEAARECGQPRHEILRTLFHTFADGLAREARRR